MLRANAGIVHSPKQLFWHIRITNIVPQLRRKNDAERNYFPASFLFSAICELCSGRGNAVRLAVGDVLAIDKVHQHRIAPRPPCRRSATGQGASPPGAVVIAAAGGRHRSGHSLPAPKRILPARSVPGRSFYPPAAHANCPAANRQLPRSAPKESGFEHDDVVHPVQELRPGADAKLVHHQIAGILLDVAVRVQAAQ